MQLDCYFFNQLYLLALNSIQENEEVSTREATVFDIHV